MGNFGKQITKLSILKSNGYQFQIQKKIIKWLPKLVEYLFHNDMSSFIMKFVISNCQVYPNTNAYFS